MSAQIMLSNGSSCLRNPDNSVPLKNLSQKPGAGSNDPDPGFWRSGHPDALRFFALPSPVLPPAKLPADISFLRPQQPLFIRLLSAYLLRLLPQSKYELKQILKLITEITIGHRKCIGFLLNADQCTDVLHRRHIFLQATNIRYAMLSAL